jgi:prepilin peptidase dependent protein B
MRLSMRRQTGFTLIEMMIGLVVGLIVIGAVSAFAAATLRATSQNAQSSRLTQDLRTAMTLVTRELRRAGHDSEAITRLGTGLPLSNYTALSVSNGCLLYQYERAGDQFRAMRLSGDAIEMATAAVSIASCGAGGNWSAVTDPDVARITGFAFNEEKEKFSSVVQSNVVGTDTESTVGCGTVRHIGIDITGSLTADATISRTIHEDVRVRADPVKFMTETFAGTGDHSAEEDALRKTCEDSL